MATCLPSLKTSKSDRKHKKTSKSTKNFTDFEDFVTTESKKLLQSGYQSCKAFKVCKDQ